MSLKENVFPARVCKSKELVPMLATQFSFAVTPPAYNNTTATTNIVPSDMLKCFYKVCLSTNERVAPRLLVETKWRYLVHSVHRCVVLHFDAGSSITNDRHQVGHGVQNWKTIFLISFAPHHFGNLVHVILHFFI